MSFLIGDRWIDARRGAFVLAPDGATHDFVSQSASRAGVLNISSPGGFESTMASIRAWFLANPPGDA
jgi:hypothetical protein